MNTGEIRQSLGSDRIGIEALDFFDALSSREPVPTAGSILTAPVIT
jgi:hypothetical protein